MNATLWDWRLKDGSTGFGYEPGVGWQAAARIGYQVSPTLDIRAELGGQQIANRLTNLTDENGNTIPNSRIAERYQSAGAALLARITPNRNSSGFYLLAGPSLAYILHATRRYSAGLKPGEDSPGKEKIDLGTAQIRRIQWRAEVGIGYHVELGNTGTAGFEFRYQLGLGGISRSPYVDSRVHTGLLNFFYARPF